MTVPPRQTVSPLNYRVPIVDAATGMPTLQFIQLLQKLNGNETATNSEISQAIADAAAALAAALAAEAIAIAAQADVDAAELEIDALQLSAVPPGGAFGDVLTKDSGTDYDMSWQPPSGGGGGSIYAPLVTGGLPGPELIATADGQCIMVLI